jgi:hypothetical protein
MSWKLRIKTKSSGEHEIAVADEAAAKEALERARIELKRAMRRPRGDVATFEEQVVVPAADVVAIDIYEDTGPRVAFV